MIRNVIVGISAVVLAILLLSSCVYLELRHTETGVALLRMTADGATGKSNDEAAAVVERIGRFHQLVLSPTASILIGLLVGALCPRRCWLALGISVSLIIVMNYPSNALSIGASLVYIFIAWLGSRAGQSISRRFFRTAQESLTA